MRFTLAVALAVKLSAMPALAAGEQRVQIDIDGTRIDEALATLTRKMGISVGWEGPIPNFRTANLRGKMNADEALEKLFRDAPFAVRRVSATSFLIIPAFDKRLARPSPTVPPLNLRRATPQPQNLALYTDIVVTAQKRPQIPFFSAVPIAVASIFEIAPGKMMAGAMDIASQVDGLAVTNLGPGRNRQFIRGVADSPFNGTSQSTVAVVLNDARLTFDAPDPDLRLVDVAQVEILKGPQGPLYGSGALGGIYRIVTRPPDLANTSYSAGAFGEVLAGGSSGGGAETVINLPLTKNRLALRAVAYSAIEGGWVDNIGRNHNANSSITQGGRASLLWEPADRWGVEITGVTQDINARDSQYVDAPGDDRDRSTGIAEPTDNDVRIGTITIRAPLNDMTATVTSSATHQDLFYRLEATPVSSQFGLEGVSLFSDRRQYRTYNLEARLSPDDGVWVMGFAYLKAKSGNIAKIESATQSKIAETRLRAVSEYAAFAEARAELTGDIHATLGARASLTNSRDETSDDDDSRSRRASSASISPSIALSWQPSTRAFGYARYARAKRPGGLTVTNGEERREFEGDELATFDLGYRWRNLTGDLVLEAGAFYTIWRNLQSDYLLGNGLIATRNAGDARILGVEASADWKLSTQLRISGGIAYTDANLIRTAQNVKVDDTRLPVTPVVTARASVAYKFDWKRWSWDIFGQANYVGPARLAFDQGLDRRMGDYVRASTGFSTSRHGLTAAVRIDNALDSHGDSFAFGNPFSIGAGRQRTPARPRSIVVSLTLAR
jgi:outer membrane receptor protein involved in Fe transport